MSTTTLRYYNLTINFLPKRRQRKIGSAMRQMKMRLSSRRLKRYTRKLIPSLT